VAATDDWHFLSKVFKLSGLITDVGVKCPNNLYNKKQRLPFFNNFINVFLKSNKNDLCPFYIVLLT